MTTLWQYSGIIAFPASILNANDIMDDLAQVFSSVGGLETVANERRMFPQSGAISNDYATVTHRLIRTPLTNELRVAFTNALNTYAAQLSGLLWYVEDLAGTLIDTNDPTRKSGGQITGKPLRWQTGLAVLPGEKYWYQGTIYEVNAGKAHTTQSGWEPDKAASLFKPWRDPEKPVEWVQPLGAHDVYPMGFRVSRHGKLWRSNHAANGWEPGVVGSENLWIEITAGGDEPPPAEIPNWVSGEALTYVAPANGANPADPASDWPEAVYRMHAGLKYRLRQNPGVNIWAPGSPGTEALWLLIP